MKFLPLLLFVIIGATGCKDKVVETENEAAPYNDAIIMEQRKIADELVDLKEALPTLDSTEILPAYDDLVFQVGQSLQAVEEMGPFEEDTSLQEAAIDLFNYYHNVFEEDYGQVIAILLQDPSEITQNEKDQIDSIAAGIAEKEAIAERQFREVQQRFAREHNLLLKEASTDTLQQPE